MPKPSEKILDPFPDDYFMKQALLLAKQAADENEVPIGAVVVAGKTIIGKGYNQVEKLNDPTAHAEMIAITAACQHLGSKFLDDCTLYITVEPCAMCAGAISWARISRLVFAADEPKFGYRIKAPLAMPSKIQIENGLMSSEAASLMKSFFESKR